MMAGMPFLGNVGPLSGVNLDPYFRLRQLELEYQSLAQQRQQSQQGLAESRRRFDLGRQDQAAQFGEETALRRQELGAQESRFARGLADTQKAREQESLFKAREMETAEAARAQANQRLLRGESRADAALAVDKARVESDIETEKQNRETAKEAKLKAEGKESDKRLVSDIITANPSIGVHIRNNDEQRIQRYQQFLADKLAEGGMERSKAAQVAEQAIDELKAKYVEESKGRAQVAVNESLVEQRESQKGQKQTAEQRQERRDTINALNELMQNAVDVNDMETYRAAAAKLRELLGVK